MTFRVEKKLFIKKENLLDFKKKISSIGAINLYKSRKVQSIYFDNINKDMYNDSIEGLNPRKKIRVRNYPDNNNKYFLLEYKISSIEGRFKVNKEISQKKFDEFKLNGIFDKKYGLCKPILNVIYDREYLIDNNVRITIDTNILYNMYNNKIIKNNKDIVVELKTSINQNIDELFEKFPFQEIRFSKYCNGIDLLNKI
ncbi:VTC domain-containing protein [Candidatus Pelagibacter sp.]|jgi:SPX domain protein involved in polyphosphate accumulation|nr:VTC domain-containing protein [Candidatus Pelagibacter sp.]